MGSNPNQLHVCFIPFMAHGHMNPLIDTARLFSERGIKVSIITTPLKASYQKTIDRIRKTGHQIEHHVIQVPYSEAELPEGCDNVDSVTSIAAAGMFFKAISLLHKPFEQLVGELNPDAIVSDVFLPWTLQVANKFNIPRLAFTGTSFISKCSIESLGRYSPHEMVGSETEPFLVPGLPHPIELTKSQLPEHMIVKSPFSFMMEQVNESESKSYGLVMNSFYGLEGDFIEHFEKEMGGKAWAIGPVALCNRDSADIADLGKEASIDGEECLKWLDKQEPSSVLYVCFGSMNHFKNPQLIEIALALENCNHSFIWVARNLGADVLPNGYEERIEGKGLIVRAWAPQMLILNHPAVGGFVTHCGWNSILEGVSAGLPMVTWPNFADQFFNEKLITEVAKVGVGVGNLFSGSPFPIDEEDLPVIRREQIEKAVKQVLGGGEEGEGMRKRAKEFEVMARKGMEIGGSSHEALNSLIEELMKKAATKTEDKQGT
ncbi:scopoletin glucosyltransferase-like isoform X2 [Tasmannia lanceolata]|uniref:scopoletin glucosyltransferase-like isoform X2 n=1 Tax=Tasmannia lanceolata TaxID=3420 RepID=UPI0040631936